MKYIHQRNRSIVFLVIFAAAVLCYMLFAVPWFRAETDRLRPESKMLEKDIGEIEAMNGDTSELDEQIARAAERLSALRAGRLVTAKELRGELTAACAAAGVDAPEISAEEEELLRPAGTRTAALYAAAAAIMFDGIEESGRGVMDWLERSETGDYEITGFAFSAGESEESPGSWVIHVKLCYYKDAPSDAAAEDAAE
ncbi:MAG: hypothetical protein LBS85_04015 [Clostridiales Family XIII bacterium]|jgi:hypothetical protein|nr:hypothetical protein [Clostridiales Family XIII bacterium]